MSLSLPPDLDTVDERVAEDQHHQAGLRLLDDGFTVIDALEAVAIT